MLQDEVLALLKSSGAGFLSGEELSRTLQVSRAAVWKAMEALRQGDTTEGGAQFISDLAPAARGGSLLCQRALDALDGEEG